MGKVKPLTAAEVIGRWFRSDAFSHATTQKEAGALLIAELDEHGYVVVPKRRRSFFLGFHEKNAAIRAYNSKAKDTLNRAEMIDAIIDAINEERVSR